MINNKLMNNNNNQTYICVDTVRKLFQLYHTTQTTSEIDDLLSKFNLNSPCNISNREYISELICSIYPNENVVKSEFINNVLMKSNNHVSIFELSVGNSRTDLCKINGKSIAYEIKTEYDNYSRLFKQIGDYMTVFEEVYVICPQNKVELLENNLPVNCGIYCYHINKNGQFKFHKYRIARQSLLLNSFAQLSVLTKQECIRYFKLSQKESKNSIIQEIESKYTSKYINSIFKKALKNKYDQNWTFLKTHSHRICNLDYQWFFKHNVDPDVIYS